MHSSLASGWIPERRGGCGLEPSHLSCSPPRHVAAHLAAQANPGGTYSGGLGTILRRGSNRHLTQSQGGAPGMRFAAGSMCRPNTRRFSTPSSLSKHPQTTAGRVANVGPEHSAPAIVSPRRPHAGAIKFPAGVAVALPRQASHAQTACVRRFGHAAGFLCNRKNENRSSCRSCDSNCARRYIRFPQPAMQSA
jgi:hypothetical protein